MTCALGPKVFRHPSGRKQPRVRAASGLDVNTTTVGSTPHVLVLLDTTLDAAQGTALAGKILARCEQAYLDNKACYAKALSAAAVTLVIARESPQSDGSGGAYHYGCDLASGGVLYVDACFADPQVTLGLFVAELDECFQGDPSNPNQGWNCGGSGGESHSRAAAERASGGSSGALGAFASAPAWGQAGLPNWVDSDQGTDQDYPSIGCGMVFLSWLGSLGYSFAQITQAAAPTLAGVYQNLTGKTTAWADFRKAVTGLPIPDDDPFHSSFGGTGSPTPPPPPPPASGVTLAQAIAWADAGIDALKAKALTKAQAKAGLARGLLDHWPKGAW